MPSYHTTFFYYYSIATSEGEGGFEPCFSKQRRAGDVN